MDIIPLNRLEQEVPLEVPPEDEVPMEQDVPLEHNVITLEQGFSGKQVINESKDLFSFSDLICSKFHLF